MLAVGSKNAGSQLAQQFGTGYGGEQLSWVVGSTIFCGEPLEYRPILQRCSPGFGVPQKEQGTEQEGQGRCGPCME